MIGAHVGIAGGLTNAIGEARKLQIPTFQIFSSSPRVWQGPVRPQEETDLFGRALAQYRLGPVLIHAKYLVNLGSPQEEIVRRSVASLIYDLNFGHRIEAAGVIVHLGSFKDSSPEKGLPSLIEHCRRILHKTPVDTTLVIENSAGAGRTIGVRFEEIAEIISRIGSPRVGFCLDTCHAFASGYDLRTAAAVDHTLSLAGRLIGWDKLRCLHLNDSLFGLGTNRDRHANIGEGAIGLAGFRTIVNHPHLRALPMIIETPNLKKGEGHKDINRLKQLIV